MSIFVTGDLHGAKYIHKLREFHRRFGHHLTRKDRLIILGDLCVPWNDPPSVEDDAVLDELESYPWTTLFLDGNHENHALLRTYPAHPWHGGRVHQLRPGVLHLMRGHVYDLEGRTFLAMGGAISVDVERQRELGIYQPGEMPTERQMEFCLRNLAKRGWQVDYVLTHCPPASQLPEYWEVYGMRCVPDVYNKWLQSEIADRASFHQWFYGHMHDDRPWEPRYVALMHVVYDLDGRFPEELWGPNNPMDDWEMGDI